MLQCGAGIACGKREAVIIAVRGLKSQPILRSTSRTEQSSHLVQVRCDLHEDCHLPSQRLETCRPGTGGGSMARSDRGRSASTTGRTTTVLGPRCHPLPRRTPMHRFFCAIIVNDAGETWVGRSPLPSGSSGGGKQFRSPQPFLVGLARAQKRTLVRLDRRKCIPLSGNLKT
jgi:hypothetical protein